MTDRLVLVTGAPGWLGTRLVTALVNGLPDFPALASPDPELKIRCMVEPRVPAGALQAISPRIEIILGDVRDPATAAALCRGAQGATLFHASGIIHARRVRDLYDINHLGTRHVVEAAIASGVRRIVGVSSNSPLGCNRTHEDRFDETSPYNPYMHYGRSKKLMEDTLNEANARGRIETVVVRPCWFYGPEQPPRQTRFLRMVRAGRAPIVGSGESRRSLSYVDNACQGLLLAARVPEARGRTYWIADRHPYTMNEIVGTVERLLRDEFRLPVSGKRLRLPSIAGRIAWVGDWLIQGVGRYVPEIHVLSEMNRTIACSVERAERELGYVPRVELADGMRRSIQWCLDKGVRL
jgi:nucleoside-diphosphate-sugar epimerase